jgi:predicted unusual protein kinase regulating ubiquinone biosynthesis (AarF/ABC1/UbiB family)
VTLLIDKHLLKRDWAQELLELITQLGPTAIKIGQAVSVQPYIIPAKYTMALSILQDQLPAFPTANARVILKQELSPPPWQNPKDWKPRLF